MNTEPTLEQVIGTKTFPLMAEHRAGAIKLLVEAAAELNSKTEFKPTLSSARLANYIANLPDSDIAVLWRYGNEPVALSLVGLGYTYYSEQKVMEEKLIYVRKPYRTLGIGQQVVDFCLSTAKANGAQVALCGNVFAHHLGDSKGIEKCYKDAGLNRVIMCGGGGGLVGGVVDSISDIGGAVISEAINNPLDTLLTGGLNTTFAGTQEAYDQATGAENLDEAQDKVNAANAIQNLQNEILRQDQIRQAVRNLEFRRAQQENLIAGGGGLIGDFSGAQQSIASSQTVLGQSITQTASLQSLEEEQQNLLASAQSDVQSADESQQWTQLLLGTGAQFFSGGGK